MELTFKKIDNELIKHIFPNYNKLEEIGIDAKLNSNPYTKNLNWKDVIKNHSYGVFIEDTCLGTIQVKPD